MRTPAAAIGALAAVFAAGMTMTAACDRAGDKGRGSSAPGARKGDRGQPARPVKDEVVARVGAVEIFQSDVLRQMRFSGNTPRGALDELIQFEVLAAAAQRAVSPDDPDVVAAQAAAAVARLIAVEIEPSLGKQDIADAVLRDVYNKAKSAFVHPRLVEVAMLNVYTGKRMKEAPRARAAETARALEAHLRQRPEPTPDDFQAIASDPAWKDRQVKFSRIWQGIDEPFPVEVGREVQRLKAPGQKTPMVTAETGFHVSIYIAEQPAKNVSFEEARDELRDQIFERWRTGRFLEMTAELAGSHAIEAYPDRLNTDPSP